MAIKNILAAFMTSAALTLSSFAANPKQVKPAAISQKAPPPSQQPPSPPPQKQCFLPEDAFTKRWENHPQKKEMEETTHGKIMSAFHTAMYAELDKKTGNISTTGQLLQDIQTSFNAASAKYQGEIKAQKLTVALGMSITTTEPPTTDDVVVLSTQILSREDIIRNEDLIRLFGKKNITGLKISTAFLKAAEETEFSLGDHTYRAFTMHKPEIHTVLWIDHLEKPGPIALGEELGLKPN